ncbi:MAG: YbaB/EbfC family nucleoid-associated protein [Nocardiopsaceae bacterium]|nr:YbaB/EbfC family nucleoid-associated protein [Nocardiopsaceae bacterium]
MVGIGEDLERLRQRAVNLQEMMQELQESSPERIESTDRTGAVRVVMRQDGLPESIQVDVRWQNHIRPQALGEAINEAWQQAVRRRDETWARALKDSGWQDRFERYRSAPEQAPGQPAQPGQGQAAQPGPGTQRTPNAIAEDVINALDTAISSPGPESQPTHARGSSPDNGIVIMLTRNGQMSCSVDARWVTTQTSSDINQALRAALAAAHEQLRNQAASTAAFTGHASQLLEESLAMLNQMARFPGTEGRRP